jgi:hypothetical protein
MGERVIKDKFNIHETYRKMNITNPYRYNSGGGGGTSQEFIANAGLTNPTHISAVQQLETDLKNANLWDRMDAIYPFVGGSANAHKYNLKDARDLDVAFRLTEGGTGLTHSSQGVVFNGQSYMNSHYNIATHATFNYSHLAVYSTTDIYSSSNDSIEIGSHVSSTKSSFLSIRGGSTRNKYGGRLYGSYVSKLNDSSLGFFGMYKKNTDNVFTISGLSTSNLGASTGTLPSRDIYIGALNFDNSPYGYSDQTIAFASFGGGFTDAEAISFNTIINDYQTNLGRNV